MMDAIRKYVECEIPVTCVNFLEVYRYESEMGNYKLYFNKLA